MKRFFADVPADDLPSCTVSRWREAAALDPRYQYFKFRRIDYRGRRFIQVRSGYHVYLVKWLSDRGFSDVEITDSHVARLVRHRSTEVLLTKKV